MTTATSTDGNRRAGRLRRTWRCYRTALARPALRRLLTGLTSGQVADQGFMVAVALYAHAHGGAPLVGAVALAQMLLAALAAPLFGRRAQQRSCRSVLWGAATAQTVLMLLTAAFAVAGAPVAAVVVLAVAGAVASGAARPVRFALLPWLATSPEELEAANVASSTSEGLSYFAGPALAGLGVLAGGPAAAMAGAAIMAGSAAVNAYRLPDVATTGGERRQSRLVDGFGMLFRQASTITVLAVTQTFVRGLLNVLIVAASLELLRTGESGVALLQALIGVGGILGALVVAAAVRGGGHAPRLALALVCWGTPLAFIGLVPNAGVAAAALMIVGIANVAVDVNAVTLLQRVLPGDAAARAFSSLECLFLLSVGAGSMTGGVLCGLVGPRAALIVAGLVLPVAVAIELPALLRLGRRLEAGHERVAGVRQVPSLAALPVAAVDLLAAGGQEILVASGTPVVCEGEIGDDVYVVIRGEAAVLKDGVEVRRAAPGQVIGEVAALYGVKRTATVVAVEDVVAIRISGPAYLSALAASAEAQDLARAVTDTYTFAPDDLVIGTWASALAGCGRPAAATA